VGNESGMKNVASEFRKNSLSIATRSRLIRDWEWRLREAEQSRRDGMLKYSEHDKYRGQALWIERWTRVDNLDHLNKQ